MEVMLVLFVGVAIAVAIRLAAGPAPVAEMPEATGAEATPAANTPVVVPPTAPVVPPAVQQHMPARPAVVRVMPAAPAVVAPPARPVRARRENWRDVEAFLRSVGVRKLYHFTDRANLASIAQHGGLFSWDYCERNGIDIPVPGGDGLSRQLDADKGLRDYVRLGFNQNHPMMYAAMYAKRLHRPVILEIDPEVLLLEGTLYSDINAAAHAARIGRTVAHLQQIDFGVCLRDSYDRGNKSEKSRYQAEVLIPTVVPVDYILNNHILKAVG